MAVYHFLSASCLGGAASEIFVVSRLKEQEVAHLVFDWNYCEKVKAAFVSFDEFV